MFIAIRVIKNRQPFIYTRQSQLGLVLYIYISRSIDVLPFA